MMNLKNKRRAGLAMIIAGVLAVAAGLGLGVYDLWDDYRAGVQADAVLDVIVRYREEDLNKAPESSPASALTPDREMPVLEIEGKRYIGTVAIPAIDIELPVQESWSLPLLKTAPCRYMGSVYQGNMIVCAHNYATHFGRLKNLLPGDEVIFTDVEGNVFRYAVAEMNTLAGTAVKEMEGGGWDLTLFTCTLGGQARVTVRCSLLEDGEA